MGSLSFRIAWPAFKTQTLNVNTHRLVVGVYQGSFSGQATYVILEAGQENAVFEKLVPGNTKVFCLAFASDNTVINGDIENALVEANQRKPVLLDLQALPFSGIASEEAQALQRWAKSLFVTPSPTATPATPTQIQSPTPTATPTTPVETPSASPIETPSPTQTLSPVTGSRDSGSSGGSSANPSPTPSPSPTTIDIGNEGGEIDSLITIDDGTPRPDTVVIQ